MLIKENELKILENYRYYIINRKLIIQKYRDSQNDVLIDVIRFSKTVDHFWDINCINHI